MRVKKNGQEMRGVDMMRKINKQMRVSLCFFTSRQTSAIMRGRREVLVGHQIDSGIIDW
jgi:hypothetical protein